VYFPKDLEVDNYWGSSLVIQDKQWELENKDASFRAHMDGLNKKANYLSKHQIVTHACKGHECLHFQLTEKTFVLLKGEEDEDGFVLEEYSLDYPYN